MSWIILRTMSGERFLCQTEADIAKAISNGDMIQVRNIYSVVTVSMLGPVGPRRMTALEYPDLQNEEPLEMMHVFPTAWYPFSDERAEEEIKELKDSMAKAKEFREELERQGGPSILRAQLDPGPVLGNLSGFKPPGLR